MLTLEDPSETFVTATTAIGKTEAKCITAKMNVKNHTIIKIAGKCKRKYKAAVQ